MISFKTGAVWRTIVLKHKGNKELALEAMDDIRVRDNTTGQLREQRGLRYKGTHMVGSARIRRFARISGRYATLNSVIAKQATNKRNLIWQIIERGSLYSKSRNIPQRVTFASAVLLMVMTAVIQVVQPKSRFDSYSLNKVEGVLLDEPRQAYAEQLKLNQQTGELKFNEGYVPGVDSAGQSSSPKIRANFGSPPENKVTVEDPVNEIGVTFKPKFRLDAPQKNQNRVVYPIIGKHASKVFTLQGTGVKEDIVLFDYSRNELKFEYDVELPDGLEMRVENDGSLGVYGPSEPLLGNVSTGSDQDVDLLKKARDAAVKDKLLFRVPAPFVLESGRKVSSSAKAWYGMKGKVLTVYASGLKDAQYPLSIDPSVYVETATKLMRGNNETNLDFDVTNELIQKGKLTGGRFDSWSTTSMTALNSARWNHATAVSGGYVYVVGGNSGSAAVGDVYWAKFNTSSGVIESTNPGDGTCTNWCTNSAYDLPAVRDAASLVAYNGYLYLIGGRDSGGTRTNTVYIAKLGLNGEPSLWHPTDTNKANWVYWYSSSNSFSDTVSYTSAVAYNNRLYVTGGSTGTNNNGDTAVRFANLNPNGDISSWSTTGMVALPSARYSHTTLVYNDRLYLIGGINTSLATANLKNSVDYIKIASDGTLSGSWTSTTAFGTARMGWGGSFATIWGGFIYVSGGCTAITSSGCSTIASDTQMASINADGSVTDWKVNVGVTSARMSYGLVSWRNKLYGIGGCTSHDTSTGNCTTTATATSYATINQDGDASSDTDSVNTSTAPCTGTDPYNCNMPPIGNGNGESGQMAGGVIVNNGILYHIGGCTLAAGTSICYTGTAGKASDTTSYAQIAADGTLHRVSSCTGSGMSFSGNWCVDNNHSINGSSGLAAFGYTVFNNVIYAVGGTDGGDWQDNVYRNSLTSTGALGSWTSQTFSNLDLGSARGYLYTFTRANPSSAGTYPGNLYVLGGCRTTNTTDEGIGCTGSQTYTEVYKCNIKTDASLEETDANDCTTSGQLQIDAEPGTGGNQGLGLMAGTVYANYIYLLGGQSTNETERGAIMYAKIDNNNDIVAVSGGIWTTDDTAISPVRIRGEAFGYNGYLYGLAGYNNGTSLSDLMFAKIDVSDGSVGNFTVSDVTVNARWDARSAVSNGYVYLMGGCSSGTPPGTCNTITDSVQTFQLYNNYSGSPAAYSTGNNVGADRIGGSSTVMNGYIYYAGGCTNIGCTTFTGTSFYAPLNADGTIGTWSSGGSFPSSATRAWGKLVNAGGTLYYLGGQNGSATTSAQSTVYYSSSISSGNPTWGTATNGLPAARTQLGAAVWNNRIYVSGGYSTTSGAVQSTVYVSPQQSSGGDITSSWPSALTSLNVARAGHTTIAYANNLYVLGGFDNANYLNDVQYTQINTDGTVDSWSYSTSLPQRIRDADGFAANGFMYLIGGRSAASTCTNNTYVAPISANTTIASGNNPTGVGAWYQTNVKFTGDRYGAAVAYDQGKTYIMGGGCSAFVSSTDRTYYSTLQSQPQVATYSRLIDTDTDVFPTVWLMNGLDNSIGARWTLRYRSMHDLDTEVNPNEDCGDTATMAQMTTWGADTNFGNVTLGNVETYTPKNGSGNNINCARYFYFYVSIDSSKAFGYPEDVSRGPTIDDLTLFFTSDPSKRLRHGKTFTGGEQQPLDTPCRRGSSSPGDPNYNCPLP